MRVSKSERNHDIFVYQKELYDFALREFKFEYKSQTYNF